MRNTVEKCQVDALRNMFDELYSKYKFLCAIDKNLWDTADNDFELFSINLLFFLKTLDSEFVEFYAEINLLLGENSVE